MIISAYTSCSVNYLPKARTLATSLKRHHPDAKLTLLLNDTLPSWFDLSSEPFDRIWQPSDLGYDRRWVFQHNVMELCTAVKGRALVRLLDVDRADFHIYFDPDVYIYNKLDPIAEYMGDAEIGLVPHITKPEVTELGVQLSEMSAAAHGTYNLGHLIIRDGPSARSFARWWADRLDKYCYDDKEYGLFTDQRWCDLAPALFDKIRILRQPNLDVASWNIHGRTIEQTDAPADGCFIVDGYPLLTYHFSGTGPTGTHRRIREIFAPSNGAVAEIERRYEEAIEAHGQSELEHWETGDNFFDNGVRIVAETRKLYRKHVDLQEAFPEPFETTNDHSLLNWLRGERPAFVSGLRMSHDRLVAAFDALFDIPFYLDRYREVSGAIETGKFIDPVDHYVRVGSRLLYDPNPYFIATYYYEQAQKLDGGSLRLLATPSRENTLLWHYLAVGLANGVEPVDRFDSTFYLTANPDVAEAQQSGMITSPLAHFHTSGDTENRMPSLRFDPQLFLNRPGREIERAIEDGVARGPFGAFIALGRVSGAIDYRLRRRLVEH